MRLPWEWLTSSLTFQSVFKSSVGCNVYLTLNVTNAISFLFCFPYIQLFSPTLPKLLSPISLLMYFKNTVIYHCLKQTSNLWNVEVLGSSVGPHLNFFFTGTWPQQTERFMRLQWHCHSSHIEGRGKLKLLRFCLWYLAGPTPKAHLLVPASILEHSRAIVMQSHV